MFIAMFMKKTPTSLKVIHVFPKGVNDEQERFMGNMIINSQCPLNRLWLVYTWEQSQLIPSGGPFRQFFGIFFGVMIFCVAFAVIECTSETGWWFGTWFFFHIFGMSSSQLTNSIIFQRGWNHQPGEFFLEFKFLRSVEGSKVSLSGLRPMSSSSQGTRIPCVQTWMSSKWPEHRRLRLRFDQGRGELRRAQIGMIRCNQYLGSYISSQTACDFKLKFTSDTTWNVLSAWETCTI